MRPQRGYCRSATSPLCLRSAFVNNRTDYFLSDVINNIFSISSHMTAAFKWPLTSEANIKIKAYLNVMRLDADVLSLSRQQLID